MAQLLLSVLSRFTLATPTSGLLHCTAKISNEAITFCCSNPAATWPRWWQNRWAGGSGRIARI